jgi:hypothetical protein
MNASDPRWHEARLVARLKNPQIHVANLSPRIPLKKAVLLITGYKKPSSALKQFYEFLEHLDQYGDPNIPLKRLMEEGKRPTWTFLWENWEKVGIPEDAIEQLTKYFRKFREDKTRELQRERGKSTAFKKKK